MIIAHIRFSIGITLLVSVALALVLFEVGAFLNAFHLVLILFVVALFLLFDEFEKLFSRLHF